MWKPIIGTGIFEGIFYDLVGYYEYRFNRDIGREVKYEKVSDYQTIDPIYDKIYLPKYIRYLMLLPITSRLSEIRQLAHTYLFLPGASHSRLEHSIGVMYRSTKILKKLKREYKLKIEQNDELIIQIASLLHDLGHPAWGHALDGITGYVVDLLKELKFFHLFSPKKLDIAITIYLLLENEQIKRALETCYYREKANDQQLHTPEKFIKFIAQIIAEEEFPLFSDLSDKDILRRAHLLTTIIGQYEKRGGVNTDRLDWMIRDSHHAGILKKLSDEQQEQFIQFMQQNKNDTFQIKCHNGEYLDIDQDFRKLMDSLRKKIYKIVYEGLERSLIDSLLTRLAYTVIDIISQVGDQIASYSTKIKAVMGYLLMQDFLMKEYTNRILSIAKGYSHLLMGDDKYREFVNKSANLIDFFDYLPCIIDVLENNVQRIHNPKINMSFDCVNLDVYDKTILIVSSQTLSEILKRVLQNTKMKKEVALTNIYNLISASRSDIYLTLDIPLLEYNIQKDINEHIHNLNCHVLANYYFFRRIDSDFRDIKTLNDLYRYLEGKDMEKTPYLFIIFDRALESDEERNKVTEIIFNQIFMYFLPIFHQIDSK